MIGDINGDDDVTTGDAMSIKQYIAGIYDCSDLDYYAAGYATGDDELSTSDAMECLKAIAGIGGDLVWYYADFYYDEADEMYYVTGEIHEDICE